MVLGINLKKELIHYTPKENIESIKEQGLLIDIDKNRPKDRSNIYKSLEDLKPKGLPDYVDLNRCIYLIPPKKETGDLLEMARFKVNTENLDLSKLYVSMGSLAGEVRRLSNKNTDEEIRISINRYWCSFKNYYLYKILDHHKRKVSMLNEFIYFDDIPPEAIREFKRRKRNVKR